MKDHANQQCMSDKTLVHSFYFCCVMSSLPTVRFHMSKISFS